MTMTSAGYLAGVDIIGDIHGHVDRLEARLEALGFRHHNNAWAHSERRAIFVVDPIDRGPGQLQTLRLVRDMVEAGHARVTLGNHELNAIAWATRDPDLDGEWLRRRLGPRCLNNRRQHQTFLSEIVEDSPEHRSWIDWFKELPVFIEELHFRVVHACWDPERTAWLRPHLNEDRSLQSAALVAALRPNNPIGEAMNVLLKGPEFSLPDGMCFYDEEGHERRENRTRWRDAKARTYRSAYIGPDSVDVPDLPILHLHELKEPHRDTFIGHSWLSPARSPAPLSQRVACIDYSVAAGGPLVAYRFDGGQTLSPDKLIAA